MLYFLELYYLFIVLLVVFLQNWDFPTFRITKVSLMC